MIPTLQHIQRVRDLALFGYLVLRILAEERDWNADTFNRIAQQAYSLKLAAVDNGYFVLK